MDSVNFGNFVSCYTLERQGSSERCSGTRWTTCWGWAGSTCSPSTSRRPSSSVLQSGTTLGQGQLASHHHISNTYYVSTKQKAKITLINANLHISRFLQGSYPNSDVERLQTQCFKSVWVATALHQVRKGKRKILIKKPLWSRSYFPTTGFDIPAQLWSPDGSTQHSPRGGR